MRFDQPFIKLPIQFDAETLEREVRALPSAAWVPHPDKFPGNEAVRLVTVDGQPTDNFEGPMRPAENLERLPYVRQIMGEIGGVWSRSRLMGLGPGAQVPVHVDARYHWRTHLRIHIPVITDPKVLFTCGDETIHMAPGECWLFDSFRWHRVENGWTERRVHLVLDTVMTPTLRALVDAARRGAASQSLAPGEDHPVPLKFEQFNAPGVMSPWELRYHIEFILSHAAEHPCMPMLRERFDRLVEDWGSIWAEYGASLQGIPDYRRTLAEAEREIMSLSGVEMKSTNDILLGTLFDALIFAAALAPSMRNRPIPEGPARVLKSQGPIGASDPSGERRIERPILIVSSPRSGSTLLFETMEQTPGLYSIGTESHAAIESIREFHPASQKSHSNRLTAANAKGPAADLLAQNFYGQLRDRDGARPSGAVRMLEKTPKNALRIPFFAALWPDSTFIYLYRDVRQTLASMIEAWSSGRFRTYPKLPGWTGLPWSLLLVPGWQQLKGLPLPEIAAHQWAITTTTMLDDLAALPRDQVRAIRYADLVAEPDARISALADSIGFDWDRPLGQTLPLSKYTVSQPDPDKWRRLEEHITPVLPIIAEADERARAFADQFADQRVS
ncbi:MAG TPA: sulfotransferase [Sphingomicrobium sp.]|nr:sulfotransferase [Sphingomicrobium sp.]